MTSSKALVGKLWRYCSLLRDDGLSYGDYLEQLTYLLFLKMSDEQHQLGQERIVPKGLDWPSLLERRGETLEEHYNSILNRLGNGGNMLGVVFRKAQNRIQDPAKLERLVKDLIDGEQWMALGDDVGDAYEGLLERNAADTKSGAGQYFTPRALISAMVEVMDPGPDMRICDPACGTGGFFLAAYSRILGRHRHLDPKQNQHLRSGLFTGWEIVDATARLCAMNLLLHGIETPDSDSPVHVDDALRADPGGPRFDMVLTNPPFGKKSSVTIVNGEGRSERQSMTVVRDDFWASTSNKQLNFLQHVKTLLKVEGRAAVVVPDNVLFEGGAGEIIRRRLLQECDVHTLLRLPTGIFYAQGVKANVLFFDRKPGSDTPSTTALWVYDLRTNRHFTLKTNPLQRADLDDFVACYRPGARDRREESERFRRFAYDDLVAREKASLDLFWLRDESLEDTDSLPPPGVIAAEIVEDLQAALDEFAALAESLQEVGVQAGED